LLLEGTTLFVSRNAAALIFPVVLEENFTQGTVGTGFGNNLLFTTIAKPRQLSFSKLRDNFIVGQTQQILIRLPRFYPFQDFLFHK
jgi:hypothetical protein